jgi:tripartite-type tricarboxylate transporter receptor subunit TctC
MQRRSWIAALVLSCTALGVSAQGNYPDQPIKWLVPYPPGGGTDTLARTLADAMRAGLGQTFLIENRPGAATNIAAEAVAHAKPDGYTIMSADNAMLAFNEHLFKKLPYNPEKDFTYIGTIGRLPLALVVNPNFPAKTFAEFLAYVKANPGKVDYASPGPGSPHHLAMEMFKTRTKTEMTHIAYKGAAPAVQDVVGGQVPVMFLDLAAGLPFIQSNKVRVLAMGTLKRSPALPDVATLAELGVADAEVFAFQGLVGPANLPPAVIAKLNQELNKALGDPAVAKKFADFGMEPIKSTPELFKALARSEADRWGTIIKVNRITLD